MKTEDKNYKILLEKAREFKCSVCGKIFDICDYQEGFTFDKWIGYGLKHGEQHILFILCCNCFDKIFDVIKPIIKGINIEDYD